MYLVPAERMQECMQEEWLRNAVFDAADKERGGRERTPDEIREYMNRLSSR